MAKQWSAQPDLVIDAANEYRAVIRTNKGDITVELFADRSPSTVNNFVFLAREGFYDGVIFHRVIQGFMIQGGDPTGTGTGGPGYRFRDELDAAKEFGYGPGILAMANAGPNTNGSQFFLMHRDNPLPPAYSVFGRTIEGLEVIDAIATTPTAPGDRPLEDVVILGVDVMESGAEG
jgi:cyclophilin family peptidyl-prolyl cis-trans isomerase